MTHGPPDPEPEDDLDLVFVFTLPQLIELLDAAIRCHEREKRERLQREPSSELRH